MLLKNMKLIYSLVAILISSVLVVIFMLNSGKSVNSINVGNSIMPKYSMSQYSDSSFVDIKTNSIIGYKNNYYICESGSKRIVVLDKDLKWVRQIGRSGLGPGEFVSPLMCEVQNDSIYVLDSEKSEIMIFDLIGNYSKSYKLIDRVSAKHRFLVKNNGNIVLSLCNVNHPIQELSNGNIVASFGEYSQTKDKRAIYLNGQRHVGGIGDRIVTVYESEPFVELFNRKGEYINRIDLSKIEKIKKIYAI